MTTDIVVVQEYMLSHNWFNLEEIDTKIALPSPFDTIKWHLTGEPCSDRLLIKLADNVLITQDITIAFFIRTGSLIEELTKHIFTSDSENLVLNGVADVSRIAKIYTEREQAS